jgi:hypothetical protein
MFLVLDLSKKKKVEEVLDLFRAFSYVLTHLILANWCHKSNMIDPEILIMGKGFTSSFIVFSKREIFGYA